MGSVNDLEQAHKIHHIQKRAFPRPGFNINKQLMQGTRSLGAQNTYVYHESTKMTLSLSILSIHCSQRTMRRFRRVVLSERSCDWLTGQGETASVERPAAADRLQKYSQSQRRKAGKIEQTFHLVHII